MAETAAQISADLVVLRAARTALAAGERVDEVARGGRRLVHGKVTLDGLSKLIKVRETDLEAATNAEAGRARRGAIGSYY